MLAYMVGLLLAVGIFDHVVVLALHVFFGILFGAVIGFGGLATSLVIATGGNLLGGFGLVNLDPYHSGKRITGGTEAGDIKKWNRDPETNGASAACAAAVESHPRRYRSQGAPEAAAAAHVPDAFYPINTICMWNAFKITDDRTPADLRRLARRERAGRAAAWMIAIANALEGMSRAEAARLAGMERQSLRDAVVRYDAESLAGLYDRPGRGAKERLSTGWLAISLSSSKIRISSARTWTSTTRRRVAVGHARPRTHNCAARCGLRPA